MMSLGSGIPELREHGRLQVPGRLGIREPLALPGQGDVEVRDGQALGALVGHAAVPAVSPDAPNDDTCTPSPPTCP